ncbi:MAG: hypothetical protein U9M95_02345 [Candidatus Altiarchaeota archaeon]|nr:hypothetical protein [Candidatus Altiarchaeota archaeon]
METDKKAYIYILMVSVLFVYVFPVTLELLDNDVFYHLLVARQIIDSGSPYFLHQPFLNHPQGLIHYYPPLFHWILVLSSMITGLEKGALYLKLLFYPLALLSFYVLVSSTLNKKTAFFSIIVLSTFFPFSARTHMAIPEALQYILIPLLLLSYLRGKEKICGFLLFLALINHLYDSLMLAVVLLTHWYLYRRETYRMQDTLLVAFPGLMFQLYGICGHLTVFQIGVDEGYLFERITLALASVFIPFLLCFWFILKRLLNPGNCVYILWFISALPVLFRLPGRFPAYIAMPLAVIVAVSLMDARKLLEKKGIYSSVVLSLLVLNLVFSTLFYPHVYDFYKPGIDSQEGEALSWIKENIPLNDVVSVGEGRSFYEGYKVAYCTGHRTTESWNQSLYLYIPYEMNDDNWSLAVDYGRYRIYHRTI